MKNKTALITGASSGIGEQIARQLAQKGVLVCINYSKSDDKAEKIANEIAEQGARHLCTKLTSATSRQCKKCLRKLRKITAS